MRALLDTHVFLWWATNDPRLSHRALEIMGDESNEILFSAVSGWEIAEKARRGRLTLPRNLETFISQQIFTNGFEVLSLRLAHALQVYSLPAYHKDPFDRMLVAQAQVEDLALLTADHAISHYSVKILW
jgi:PIN domain nuclease of toxin-antitoxin system